MQDFWGPREGSNLLGLHAKEGGGGSSFGLNVKKPTLWAKSGGPDPRTPNPLLHHHHHDHCLDMTLTVAEALATCNKTN